MKNTAFQLMGRLKGASRVRASMVAVALVSALLWTGTAGSQDERPGFTRYPFTPFLDRDAGRTPRSSVLAAPRANDRVFLQDNWDTVVPSRFAAGCDQPTWTPGCGEVWAYLTVWCPERQVVGNWVEDNLLAPPWRDPPRAPFAIEVPITRVVARETDPNTGQPRHLDRMIDEGVIDETAALHVMTFNVTRPLPPGHRLNFFGNAAQIGFVAELDVIRVNGTEVRRAGSSETYLEGGSGIFKLNRFDVPIQLLRFPTLPGPGEEPEPALNYVEVLIDQDNIGRVVTLGDLAVFVGEDTTDSYFCPMVDWVSLAFRATSPIVLIHGNGQGNASELASGRAADEDSFEAQGRFFRRTGFTAYLEAQGLPWDDTIQLPVARSFDNSSLLGRTIRGNGSIPSIAQRWGVDSLHLVAHGKGGLDAREYVGRLQALLYNDEFEVLSLITLSTPLDGSSIARLSQDLQAVVQTRGSQLSPNQLAAVQQLFDPGLADTAVDGHFHSDNFRLTRAVRRSRPDGESPLVGSVGADADRDGDGTISPGEALGVEGMFPTAIGSPLALRNAISPIYEANRDVAEVDVTIQPDGSAVLRDVIRRPNGNDVLVRIESAHGLRRGWIGITTRAATYTTVPSFTTDLGIPRFPDHQVVSESRNHFTVADAAVAEVVTGWILEQERQVGDWRPLGVNLLLEP